MRALRAVILSLAIALATPTAASAHGREPVVLGVAVDPDDAAHLAVMSSFGLLESRDAGRSWRWLCLDLYGASVLEDPQLLIEHGGMLWVGTRQGLRRSRDGCDFERVALGPVTDAPITALGRARDGSVLVVSSVDSQLFRGVSGRVAPFGPVIPDEVGVPTSLEVDDQDRIWLGAPLAGTTREGAVLVTDGSSWAVRRVPLHLGERRLDVLLARADVALVVARPDPRSLQADRLLWVHADGAVDELEPRLSRVAGATLDDGRVRVVGDGMLEGEMGESLVRTGEAPRACVVAHMGGLLVCGRPYDDSFILGWSEDGGRSVVPWLVPGDLREPFACPAGHPANAVCGAAWDDVVLDLALDPRLFGRGGRPPAPACSDRGTPELARRARARGSRARRARLSRACSQGFHVAWGYGRCARSVCAGDRNRQRG